MHAIAHGGCTDTVRESALKVDSGRKIPCRTGESNLRRRCAGPILYQLSYIPYISKLDLELTNQLNKSKNINNNNNKTPNKPQNNQTYLKLAINGGATKHEVKVR